MRLSRWLPLILLVASCLFIFRQQIFFGAVVGDLDMKLAFLPIEALYAEHQARGELPWWTPALGFGHPLIGWGQLGFFAPVHLVLRALQVQPVQLLALSPFFYTLLGLLGMYGFLRSRAYAAAPAAIGAAIFAYNGFMAGHLLHSNFHVATLVLPYLLWALSRLALAPSLPAALAAAVAAAVIAESGAPPVVLFAFAIAAIVFAGYIIQAAVQSAASRQLLVRIAAYTLLGGLLGFGLAAIRLLPLLEFIPHTERWQQGLPIEELYNFSIPPASAVTLLIPRFFFADGAYWGPKGFIEMAAFAGIAPLMLAGLALVRVAPLSLSKERGRGEVPRPLATERLVGTVLVALGAALALGQYSPLYRWIIEEGYLASIGGTGRYMYIFFTGLALLAATGVQDWLRLPNRRQLAGLIVFPLILAAPVLRAALNNPAYRQAFSQPHVIAGWWEAAISAGIAAAVLYIYPIRRLRGKQGEVGAMVLLAVVLAGFALHHSDYYSLAPRQAFATGTLGSFLQDYRREAGVNPRLYARQNILQEEPIDPLPESRRPTDILNENFRVIQPLHSEHSGLACLVIPLEQVNAAPMLQIDIREAGTAQPVRSVTASGEDRDGYPGLRFCFDPIEDSAGRDYLVAIQDAAAGGTARLLYVAEDNPGRQAYFIRVSRPTDEQLQQSHKNARLVLDPVYAAAHDLNVLLLESHVQAAAGAGSARWWGSLPDERYAKFVDAFMANNGPTRDGEGRHVLERYRRIWDMSGITHLTQLVTMDARDQLPELNFEVIARQDWWGHEARLYRNPQAYPKAFLVPSGMVVESLDAAVRHLRQEGFDPRAQALIEGDINQAQLPAGSDLNDGEVEVLAYENTRVAVRARTAAPAILVVNDQANPQWVTRLNNQPAPHLIANGVFRAAVLPAGDHIVTFTYESPAARRGAQLSAISAAAIIILFAGSSIRRRPAGWLPKEQ